VVANGATVSGMGGALDGAMRVLAYNLGRIGSYATAGALAGGLAGGARALSGISAVQAGGYWLANLMLIVLGLYLMDAWHGLARLESFGQALWRRLQPFTKFLLPLDSLPKMLALGSLWGWLPCGMVYSMLLTAMLTGSAVSGASVMLVFGLGTLPTLLALGLLGAKWRNLMQRRQVRIASGLIVLTFGLIGLLRAANGLPASWLDAVCITHSGLGAAP
jgi:sulfite exporter TauE/SafE